MTDIWKISVGVHTSEAQKTYYVFWLIPDYVLFQI